LYEWLRRFANRPNYLKLVPDQVDSMVVITDKERIEAIAWEYVELGMSWVWMHESLSTHPRMGKGVSKKMWSISKDAVGMCRENKCIVMPGSCPMQFVGDVGHRCMHGFLRVIGALKVWNRPAVPD